MLVLAVAVSAVSLSIAPKHHGDFNSDGTPTWINRNDVDWEPCSVAQIVGQSSLLTVAIEEEHGSFVDHHAFLYRCATGMNPFYLRHSLPQGGTVLLKLLWPDILDENYLFASTAEDKDQIGYGFRIGVASATKDRFHFRRFFFHTLADMNHFIVATSTLMNNTPTKLHKADFFKAPRYTIAGVQNHAETMNEFGDHYFGKKDEDLLAAADQAQPIIDDNNAFEDQNYVANMVQQDA